jgi:hypothetical protein
MGSSVVKNGLLPLLFDLLKIVVCIIPGRLAAAMLTVPRRKRDMNCKPNAENQSTQESGNTDGSVD